MLSLLRVDIFTVPSGTGFIEELVTKVSGTRPIYSICLKSLHTLDVLRS
jgi:hypothetical protein